MINLNSKHSGQPSHGSTQAVGMLILLGTPVGNLADLSHRGIEALRSADVIAAEDTRRLRVLLAHCHIENKSILSIDANKEDHLSSKVLELVNSGKTVVYTTDAGMPGISDPGAKLVKAVSSAGLPVDAVPGPSAVVLAASLSALCESGFVFAGFLAVKAGPRKKTLENLSASGFASIVFESPNRIGPLLNDALVVYGSEHPVFVGRELTKLHQELFYGSSGEASSHFGNSSQRGEFVVVFGAMHNDNSALAGKVLLDRVIEALNCTGGRTKILAEELAELTGVGKNQVYSMLVKARRKGEMSPS